MDALKFMGVIRKYKKCPGCGRSWKGTDLQVQLKNEVVEVSCKCWFLKYVDENNKVSLDVVADKLQKGKITPNQARVMCGLEPITARSSVMEGHMRVWEEAKK